MSERESTAVGYRLRIQPPDLGYFPDSVKQMWFGWVLDYGLRAKDKDLARGMDKNGKVGVLDPKTIKYRKSEVGPTTKDAPYLTPSYARSRVRSLLTGRAHVNSAEFFWRFDSVTGRSFATILHYQADEYGHDVFGLSDAGTAWTMAMALKKWNAWKAAGGELPQPRHVSTLPPISKQVIRTPIRKIPVTGRIDLQNMDLMGDEGLIKRAIDAGQFTGFRRLNARGERWVAGGGAANEPTPWSQPGWRPRPMARPQIARAALPEKITQKPIKAPPPILAMTLDQFAGAATQAAQNVPSSLHYHGGGVWVIDAFNEFIKAHPAVSLTEFKRLLLEAHESGKIQLRRADTSGWGGELTLAKDRASSIEVEMMGQGMATYQIIVL